MRGLILQFGTSRFLQAHVDLFAHEARVAGQDVPPIVVVQTSGSPERAARVDAFNDPAGYQVRIRGLIDGAVVDRSTQVQSVARGLSAQRDWVELVATFVGDATFVVSNTGDSGYTISVADQSPQLFGSATPPSSFPGILATLLWQRWRAGATPVTILPCELIRCNGSVLRALLLELPAVRDAPTAFQHWLSDELIWCDTLVDRIVPESLSPLGAIAEPYALWAVGDRPGLVLPFQHAAITCAADLEPYERLKLHILNLGHTVLAQQWIDAGRPAGATVRGMLEEPETLRRLLRIYDQEILPGFAAHGLAATAVTYMQTTLDRFRNPLIHHAIADIAINHEQKIQRRVVAFLEWSPTRQCAHELNALARASA
jgi:tagaturonate reductase